MPCTSSTRTRFRPLWHDTHQKRNLVPNFFLLLYTISTGALHPRFSIRHEGQVASCCCCPPPPSPDKYCCFFLNAAAPFFSLLLDRLWSNGAEEEKDTGWKDSIVLRERSNLQSCDGQSGRRRACHSCVCMERRGGTREREAAGGASVSFLCNRTT